MTQRQYLKTTKGLKQSIGIGLKVTSVLLLIMLVSTMLGCASKDAPLPPPQAEIEFFDAFSFDRKLSSSLRSEAPTVTVLFPAAITLNSIPQRMDIWLSKVEEFGGTVEIVPVADNDKGILSEIVSLFVQAYEYLKDKAIYAPAELYNAKVYYKKNSGIIVSIVFEKK